MATVKENLIAAKALIDTPQKWKKNGWGSNGCYCALGALMRASNAHVLRIVDRSNPDTKALLSAVPEPFESVVAYNDHSSTTHADIMALFDRAIAAADDGP